jgi:hypothetical protein
MSFLSTDKGGGTENLCQRIRTSILVLRKDLGGFKNGIPRLLATETFLHIRIIGVNVLGLGRMRGGNS